MTKKTQTQKTKDAMKEAEQKAVKAFVDDYIKLCEQHGIQLGAILDIQVGGIKPKVVPIAYDKKPTEEKETDLVR